MAVTVKKRLLRRPGTTVLWLLLCVVMTAFLTVAVSLWLGARSLARAVDEKHTAIAVRTDRVVRGTYERWGYTVAGISFSVEDRSFEQAELDWLNAQPSVKVVRIHSLTGGYSEDFESYLGVRRELSFRTPEDPMSYRRCIAAGTVLQLDQFTGRFLLGVERLTALHPEFEQALTWTDPNDVDADYLCYLSVSIPGQDLEYPGEGEFRLEVGQRYVLSGEFYAYRDYFSRPLSNYYGGVYAPMLYTLPAYDDGTGLYLARQSAYAEDEAAFAAYDYPAAQLVEGDLDGFLAAHPIWAEYSATLERHLHSLPVLGTERLEALYMFVKNEAAIIDGRSFTAEEYAQGARVMVISEATAAKHCLAVGDKVTMAQFLCASEEEAFNPSTCLDAVTGQLHRPVVGTVRPGEDFGPSEEFEIVGIYRLSDYWSKDSYAFTTDTVFIPQKAQMKGAWGPDSEDLYGVYLSVELNNGMEDDFKLALANSPYAGRYYTVDQGFEQVQRNLNDLHVNARRLALTALAAWGIFVLLYLMMYQAAQRRNLGVMRSQGAGVGAARRYLFLGGLLTAACGLVLGAAVSWFVLRAVQGRILADLLGQIELAAEGAPVISEQTLRAMVKASGLSLRQLALWSFGQLGLLAVILWIHAAVLARRNPRRLMEV